MKNMLVLTYWSYKDALIQTYTLPYVRIIRKNIPKSSKIFLFTFEQSHLKMTSNEWKEEKEMLSSEGIYLLRFSYSHFGLIAIIKIILLIFRLLGVCIFKNISKINSWCTPAGAIGYLLSIITGKPLIIDSYEPHAESMVENGNWRRKSFAFKLLFYLEKKQTKRAKAFIATTHGMKHYAQLKYNVNPNVFFVKPACINFHNLYKNDYDDETLKKQLKIKDEIVCVYAGKIGGIYLEKEIFDFFKVANEYWNGNFKIIMLTSTIPEIIHQFCKESDLQENNVFIKFVSQNEVFKYMAIADFAINPVKPVPTKRFCTSIKDGEYWAMGLPIVITPDISDDSEIIANNNIGSVLKSLNNEGYLTAIKEIDDLLKNTNKTLMKNKIKKIAEQFRSIQIAEEIYGKIYAT